MTVIEAAAMRCRTLADGSLRIEVEIEPRNAQAAFALFGTPGRAMALAALADGHGAVSDTSPERVAETPKKEREYLGDLCYRAVQWCNDYEFQGWIQGAAQAWGPLNPEVAKAILCDWCGIESRKELDTNPEAAKKFNQLIRGPYQKHLQARGLV